MHLRCGTGEFPLSADHRSLRFFRSDARRLVGVNRAETRLHEQVKVAPCPACSYAGAQRRSQGMSGLLLPLIAQNALVQIGCQSEASAVPKCVEIRFDRRDQPLLPSFDKSLSEYLVE